ncbi:MAG: hypothetical protein WD009_04200 [Phycisphaeraceae bacterium]
MQRTSWPLRVGRMSVVALAICLTTGSMAAGEEGLEASALRPRLDEATYLPRREAALERLPSVADLEASPFPTMGAHVIGINRGHQAEELGLSEGCVLVSFNDEPVVASIKPRARRQRMAFVTPEGERREERVAPGMIGVRWLPYNRPELAYIRSPERDPALDADMLAAIAGARHDPDLAEAALHRALAAGYGPNELTNSVAALIALHQGRPSVAEQFASRMPLLVDDAEGMYGLNPLDRYRIALANGRVQQMVEIADRYGSLFGMEPESLENARAMARQSGSRPDPDRLLSEGMARRDLRPEMKESEDRRLVPHPNRFEWLEANEPFDFARPAGSPYSIAAEFRRGEFNFEFVIRGQLSARPRSTRWNNTLEMKALDLAADAGHGRPFDQQVRMTMISVSLDRPDGATGGLDIGGGFVPQRFSQTDPTIDLSEPFPFELRMIHVDGWVQAVLNGVPVALLPAEARQPALLMRVVGARARIESVELWELLDG